MSRLPMRFVTVKSVAQQDVQAIHRIRSGLVGQRTSKANHMRGLVGEYGIVATRGIGQLRCALPCWLEDAENGLSKTFRVQLNDLWRDLQHQDERVDALNKRLARAVKEDPVAQRLSTLRRVGPLGASALAVALRDGSAYSCGKDLQPLWVWFRVSKVPAVRIRCWVSAYGEIAKSEHCLCTVPEQ